MVSERRKKRSNGTTCALHSFTFFFDKSTHPFHMGNNRQSCIIGYIIPHGTQGLGTKEPATGASSPWVSTWRAPSPPLHLLPSLRFSQSSPWAPAWRSGSTIRAAHRWRPWCSRRSPPPSRTTAASLLASSACTSTTASSGYVLCFSIRFFLSFLLLHFLQTWVLARVDRIDEHSE